MGPACARASVRASVRRPATAPRSVHRGTGEEVPDRLHPLPASRQTTIREVVDEVLGHQLIDDVEVAAFLELELEVAHDICVRHVNLQVVQLTP